MQYLKANIEIPIPNDYVVISKVELEELERNSLKGVYWTMADLENRTSKKHEWLKENILYVPRFKKILSVEYGGFVYYPNSKGEKWSFLASKMSEFLEKNFADIFK